MRACELMAGRMDDESALLARGAVAMTLLSIATVGVRMQRMWTESGLRIENRGT